MKALFVCTGNTCRSPMAAALWGRLGGVGASAGLYARDGEPASANAVRVMEEMGLDLSGHRAQTVTESMVRDADAVFGMTETHAAALAARFPAQRGKIRPLPLEIPDPFGGDLEDYRTCADHLLHRKCADFDFFTYRDLYGEQLA